MKTENPIIWKKEKCLIGQCHKLSSTHLWSIPFTAPQGLVSECYNCRKTRVVQTNSQKKAKIKRIQAKLEEYPEDYIFTKEETEEIWNS